MKFIIETSDINEARAMLGAVNAAVPGEEPTAQAASGGMAALPPPLPIPGTTPAPSAVTPPVQPAAMQAPVAPTPLPAQANPSAPVQPAGAPTSAPTYTLDMLSRAAVSLREVGKDVVSTLFPKYGIQAMNQLPPARYGEFALDLRQMGAQI